MRLQLRRIVASPDFDATDRTRKFLTYVVEETLAGRADRIKAYSVATEVFGRNDQFDAHSDPVVRIEAGHLRRALERYYLTAGISDAVMISVPKGSYVPKFEFRASPAPTPPVTTPGVRPKLPVVAVALLAIALLALLGSRWIERDAERDAPAVPRLLVTPFEDLTNSGNSEGIARGLTREIVGQIAKFKDIVIIEGDAGTTAASSRDVRYVLAGDVNLTDTQFHLRARVLNRDDNSVIWANSYDGALQASRLVAVEETIAEEVSTALAQPYGVIFQADASRKPDHAPDDWQAYSCTLAYYAYRAALDAKTHPTVRKCLEDAVRRFPGYATAWALLSQTYIDEVRFRYPIDPSSSPASIDRALAAARRAVELDPENIRALQAEMFALYFHGDIKAALAVGESAQALNPNDTELLGEYGFRLALAGDWPKGCAMIGKARQRNPGPLAYYEAALALCGYFNGDYREAAMWISKARAVENPNYHLIAAAVFTESGDAAEAARERDWLMAHAPKLLANIRAELAIRIVQPEDIDRIVASLLKGGVLPEGGGAPQPK